MKEVLDILKQKKLQSFFLFYIILLVPFLSPLAQNLDFIDKVAVFIVCGLLFLAILVLSLFIDSKSERIIYSILLAISIIPGSIYLGYLLFAGVLLEQNSVTSLFETNPEESKEFVAYYLSLWVIAGVLIYAAIPIIMICLMKPVERLSKRKHIYLFTFSLIVIFSVIGFNQLSRSVYFINIYKTFISYKLRTSNEIKSIKERQKYDYSVESAHSDSVPQTIVVVIGESLSKRHMSLYGYKRNTNPLLSSMGDSLIVYKDVVSPQVHTIPVMRSLLSMAELDNPDFFTKKPSLYELFNRAGYDTYLISNQEFSEEYKSSYDILLSLAKKKYNLAPYKQHDDIILPVLDSVLNRNSDKSKLILVHLIGNHMAYEFRYPKEFIVFNHNDSLVIKAPHMDKKAVKTIDKYDNSVLYNDFLIHNIIRTLQAHHIDNSAMIYFSDHGEELYEYRDFAGHAYEKVSPPMCEIPFIVWMSESYKRNRPNLIFDKERPYSTADFIYSISDLAGLRYKDYDNSRSLFSKDFIPKERFVGTKKYEEVKRNYEL